MLLSSPYLCPELQIQIFIRKDTASFINSHFYILCYCKLIYFLKKPCIVLFILIVTLGIAQKAVVIEHFLLFASHGIFCITIIQ